ncbi:MAG: phosphatidylglycerophosphatase A [Pseudohongiellaceae bacterium]
MNIEFCTFNFLKPWKIKWVDRHVKDGLGIMPDDVLAGIMTAVNIQTISVFVN